MSRRLLLLALLTGAGPLLPHGRPARAHDGIHRHIRRITEQIDRQPSDPGLLLARADLYREHDEYDRALSDIDRAAGLDPGHPAIDLCRGKLLRDMSRLKAARAALDRFLARKPDHAGGLLARARTLVALDEPLSAADDYTRAIESSDPPRPKHYLERARALVAAGPPHLDAALRGLDEGLARLGPIVPLQLYALELERGAKRYDAALERIGEIAKGSRRKDRWLARRGEILEEAGRREEARAAYRTALDGIRARSLRERRLPSVAELAARIRSALDRLSTTEASPREAGSPQSTTRSRYAAGRER